MAKQKEVMVRIKRFGNQFATCGIGLRPPEHLISDSRMKRLCPKLVPGQVVTLPATHPLVTKRSKHVEIVHEIERDEILRPWVFTSPEAAVMANPSKSRLTADQIADGLALTEGALANAPKHRRKAAKEKAEELAADDDEFDYDAFDDVEFDDDDPRRSDDEPDDEDNERRSQNREPRDIKKDAVPVEDDDDDDEPVRRQPRPPKPTTRAGRRAAVRQPRGK